MTRNTKQLFTGEQLSAPLDSYPGVAVIHENAYWMGVVPSCPVNQINVAGLNFSKLNEIFVDDPARTGNKLRVPVIGELHRGVTLDHIHALAAALPRLVLRFPKGKGSRDVAEEPGAGENIGDVHVRTRKGFLIRVPTEEMIAAAKEGGVHRPRYVRKPGDEPAADYMYFKLCDNQEEPHRGVVVPPSISVAGLEWPALLDDDGTDLLS